MLSALVLKNVNMDTWGYTWEYRYWKISEKPSINKCTQ